MKKILGKQSFQTKNEHRQALICNLTWFTFCTTAAACCCTEGTENAWGIIGLLDIKGSFNWVVYAGATPGRVIPTTGPKLLPNGDVLCNASPAETKVSAGWSHFLFLLQQALKISLYCKCHMSHIYGKKQICCFLSMILRATVLQTKYLQSFKENKMSKMSNNLMSSQKLSITFEKWPPLDIDICKGTGLPTKRSGFGSCWIFLIDYVDPFLFFWFFYLGFFFFLMIGPNTHVYWVSI